MFLGSIPDSLRRYVVQCAASWGTPSVWVGCSGAFTIERCLTTLERHSNDVSIYSSVVGWWATGDPRLDEVRLNPAGEEHLHWLAPYLADPTSKVATVLLGSTFFSSVGKDNLWHQRQVRGYREQWERLHAETAARISKVPLRLASYAAKDVSEWLAEDVPADGPVMMYPPFMAGGYETMWRPLEKFLDWPAPAYPKLTAERIDRLLDQVVDRPRWLIATPNRTERLDEHLRSTLKTTNRGIPVWVYASDGSPTRVVAPKQDLRPVDQPRLTPDDELTGRERVSLAPIVPAQFAALRSQYFTPTIPPGTPLVAYAVLLDGKIAGCIAFGSPQGQIDPHIAYLMSDFPVAPTRYDRLAALMGTVAQSTEVQQLLQRSLSRRIEQVTTTAFSHNPTSMKYRSAGLKLLTRRAGTDGVHAHQLQYGAPAGRWSMAEGYAKWLKSHGKYKVTAG